MSRWGQRRGEASKKIKKFYQKTESPGLTDPDPGIVYKIQKTLLHYINLPYGPMEHLAKVEGRKLSDYTLDKMEEYGFTIPYFQDHIFHWSIDIFANGVVYVPYDPIILPHFKLSWLPSYYDFYLEQHVSWCNRPRN